MQEVSKDIFYQAIACFEWIPFTQTLAYNLSVVQEESLHFFIDDMNHPLIGCVGYERRKLGLKMLCVCGECLNEISSLSYKRYSTFYQDLRKTAFDIYELNLNTVFSNKAEIALRTAGYLRPVGLFSTELSKIVATTAALKYDKSWKHNLKKAHDANLHFEVKTSMERKDIQTFVSCHHDLQRHKGFLEELSIDGLLELSKDEHFKMGIVTDTKGDVLAGCIFYARKAASTTIYSFSTSAGRESGAAYRLREGIILYLAYQGLDSLDMGRISPGTNEKNNIFLFKDGISGEYVQYLGEWEYCQHEWLSVLLYFAKKYLWKRIRV